MAVPSFKLDGIRRHKMLTAAIAKRLPALGETDGQGYDAICRVKFFGGGRMSFFVTEFDGDDTLYGYMISPLGPDCDEWGYSSLSELAEANRNGLPLVERDCYFAERPVRDCIKGAGLEVPA